MLPKLDPLLHAQLRLQIITLLVQYQSADFNFLLEQTEATRGNLSVQLKKLSDAQYLEISKSFGESYPITTCKITEKGRGAFEKYVEKLSIYLNASNTKKK